MAPALLKKLFGRSSKPTDHERLLAPSLSASSSEKVVTKKLDTGTSETTSTEDKDKNKHDIKTCSVQICPHEALSFERMKRIVNLPRFKYYGRNRIGAFTQASSHHHVPCSEGTYRCKPYPKDFSSLKAKGSYNYQMCWDGGYAGLVLSVDWSMNLDEHTAFTGSVPQLQNFLNALDIHLCQHITMGTSIIANELFALCNPSRVGGDPVEAYEKAHRAERGHQCMRCPTEFETYQEEEKCHILVKRYLGQGTSIYDGRWLAQCGEGNHRLRSLGVAALQSLKGAGSMPDPMDGLM